MEEWQNRVVEERAELEAKLLRLDSFIGNSKFNALEKEDKSLLQEQLKVMMDYHFILSERIARWSV